MYETVPHQTIEREEDHELVCARCGLVNPGEDDPCVSAHLQPPLEDKKAA